MTREFRFSIKLITFGFIMGVLVSVIAGFIGCKLSDKDAEPVDAPAVVEEEPKEEEPEITIEYINKKLNNISELSTAEMIYNGLYTVVEGKIPFITQKGFSMTYTSEIKAGIDASKIQTEITEDKVIITLPQAEILSASVDPESIQFYDEKYALFNWSEKEDVKEALIVAQEDMEAKANKDGLLKRASRRADDVILGLLEDVVGDRKVVVEYEKATADD